MRKRFDVPEAARGACTERGAEPPRSGLTGRPGSENRRGAVAVFVALLLLVLIGFVGLAVDGGRVLTAKQQLQAAADAAALAACQIVENDSLANDPSTPYHTTRQAAVDIAAQNDVTLAPVQLDHNYPNALNGQVVVGFWDVPDRTFTPDTIAPNAVRVHAFRSSAAGGGPVNLTFGPLFSRPTFDIDRVAIATTGNGQGPAILVLDPTGTKAMDIRGTPYMEALGRAVHVNSSASDALYMNGSPDDPRLVTRVTRVHGQASYPSGSVTPPPRINSWVEPDYLAYLPDHPDPGHTLPDYGSITGPGTYDPGWYPGGVNFNGGVAQLNPGVYVIGPPGIDLNADAQLHGDGVMLFLDLGGFFRIAGQGTAGIDLSPPTSGIWDGICYYQHRQNTNSADLSGGGLFDVEGTMYLKNALLGIDGTPHRRVGRIVTFRLQLRGTNQFIITGHGPPPTDPPFPHLVE